MHTRRLAALAALVLLFTRAAHAQAPADSAQRVALAAQLLDAMDFDHAFERNTAAMNTGMMGLTGAAEHMQAFNRKYFTPAVLRPPVIAAYARFYTAAELQELITFYSSPTGKKSLALAPEVQKALSPVIQKIVTEHGDEMLGGVSP